jgi:preprotein translocase subunit SecE
MKIEIYKKGQGKYTRLGTVIGVMLIVVAGAKVGSSALGGVTANPFVQYGIPAAAIVILGLLIGQLVNRSRVADFLIATEGEMKKVSWSSRKEVIGSTKVVIVTTLIMALVLFVVDMLFHGFFMSIGILGS